MHLIRLEACNDRKFERKHRAHYGFWPVYMRMHVPQPGTHHWAVDIARLGTVHKRLHHWPDLVLAIRGYPVVQHPESRFEQQPPKILRK